MLEYMPIVVGSRSAQEDELAVLNVSQGAPQEKHWYEDGLLNDVSHFQ